VCSETEAGMKSAEIYYPKTNEWKQVHMLLNCFGVIVMLYISYMGSQLIGTLTFSNNLLKKLFCTKVS
jgi:hypothetical protein